MLGVQQLGVSSTENLVGFNGDKKLLGFGAKASLHR
jgi:hypothetical protein